MKKTKTVRNLFIYGCFLFLMTVSNMAFSQFAFYNWKLELVDVENVFYFKKAIGVEKVGIDTYDQNGEDVMEFYEEGTGKFLGIAADTSKINLKELKYLKRDSRMRVLLSKYSWPIAERIYRHQVYIGMPANEALESWGKPENVNRTTTANLVREQWVYSNGNYLYFENGIVTTIQN